MEGTSQAVLGCQLVDFKKPTLPFAKEKGPTGFRHKSQTTEGSVLRPFSYTKMQQDVLQAEEKARRAKDE